MEACRGTERVAHRQDHKAAVMAKTFTEKEIRKALKDFEAVDGRCGQDRPEMLRLMLREAITLAHYEKAGAVVKRALFRSIKR